MARVTGGFIGLGLLLAACGDLSEDGRVPCDRLGTLGCPCDDDHGCDADGGALVCVEGVCRAAPCPEGTLDCPCGPDGACGEGPDGPMVCLDGRCAPDPCPAGTEGCACAPGARCAAGLVCDRTRDDPVCIVRPDCPPGRRGCPCYADETCDDPSGPDGIALVCDGAICVEDQCVRGEPGCTCLPGGRCVEGAFCRGLFCVEDTGQTREPPENPRCYTPCWRDLVVDGVVVRDCSPEGLMEGCVDGTVCVDGSCRAPVPALPEAATTDPGTCGGDADCPEHQTCVVPAGAAEGRCYSDCEGDGDGECRGGRECRKKVCRLPCRTADPSACGDGEYCKAIDGDPHQGHCFPVVRPLSARMEPMDPPRRPRIGLQLAELDDPPDGDASIALDFVSDEVCRAFTVTNLGDRPARIDIERASHQVLERGEPRVERENPLTWLRIEKVPADAEDACASNMAVPAEDAIELEPDARVVIRVANAHNPDEDGRPHFARWEGRLVINATHEGVVARRSIPLTFAQDAGGRWSGRAYFLADFGEAGLQAWMDAGRPTRGPVVQKVANALVRRWLAAYDGRLPYPEFEAVLRATRDGSWNRPEVRRLCPEGAACYLANNIAGYGIYTDSEQDVPVPAGVTAVPLTLALGVPRPDGEGEIVSGHIVSAESLQYPGDPQVVLRFASPTEGCGHRRGGHCTTRLDGLDATIRVGGRYPAPAEGCAGAFGAQALPWLVPGFTSGTILGPRGGERVRPFCLDGTNPFGDRAEVRPANRSLSRANPMPTGQGIERRLTLIDGAMLDQTTLFALFREEILPPLDIAEEGMSAYGYMLLERVPGSGAGRADARTPPALPEGVRESAVGCPPELVTRVLGPGATLSASTADRIGIGVVEGIVPPPPVEELTPIDPSREVVHYLCWANGRFNAGPDGRSACPAGSEVTFFTLSAAESDGLDLDNHECQTASPACRRPLDCVGCETSNDCAPPCEQGEQCFFKGSCAETLQGWLRDDTFGIRRDPLVRHGEDGEPGVIERCEASNDLRSCHEVFAAWDAATVDELSGRRVGYLCHDTGRFGPGNGDCPPGSEVTWFLVPDHVPDIAAAACNDEAGVCNEGEPCARFDCPEGLPDDAVDDRGDIECARRCVPDGSPCPFKGNCEITLDEWRDTEPAGFSTALGWRCEDRLRGTCDDDRRDLTRGKRFFETTDDADQSRVVLRPLDAEIEAAFRYKTRFRNREGTNLGFTPEICRPGADARDYCYDPAAIEAIRDRVDCAAHVYTSQYENLSSIGRAVLQAFLERTFSLREERVFGLATPVTHDGFERAYAELLVMLGDEAFTRALSSRFDRAGVRRATFYGQDFEEGGIELRGVAGFEMFSLHLAVQYYELALERFFHLGPVIHDSLNELPDGEGFVTLGTVTGYFERLLRASNRKAAAWAAIAERYQLMQMDALARRVVERAFTATHLESVFFSRVMQDVVLDVGEVSRPQIRRILEGAQVGWESALRTLQEQYAKLDDEPRFLGIPEGFVPFPPLDPFDINAFEKILGFARRKVQIAADKEVRAIQDSRAFDTSAAEFRNALSALRTEYESQLGEICGTFQGEDGGVYPAIARYAHLHPRARRLGDPCGRMGNGAINDALLRLEQARLHLDEVEQQRDNIFGTMEGLNARMRDQCSRIEALADWTLEQRGEIKKLRQIQSGLTEAINALDVALELAGILSELADCELPTLGTSNNPGTCFKKIGLTLVSFKGRLKVRAAQMGLRAAIRRLDELVGGIESDIVERNILEECAALRIDTMHEISGLFSELPVMALRLQRLAIEVERALGEADALLNKAEALQATYAESEALLIDVEAARNDPNVRIYRSDAVLAADRTFAAALEEVYEATLVFEYYTGQSYADRDRLRFIRLASHGEDNLERYLAELSDAFDEFEDRFGNPDVRVMVISLRDELTPQLLEANGEASSENDRSIRFRERLRDAARTDPQGRYTVAFALDFDRLSPLTFNHKIRFIEAELVGEALGDELGRLQVTPSGTSTVRGVEEPRNYSLPARTAVLNPFFNGRRSDLLDAAIYRSERLRDRPVVNTEWNVVFDRTGELVNRDIRIGALTDIHLYIYYTDFTEAP